MPLLFVWLLGCAEPAPKTVCGTVGTEDSAAAEDSAAPEDSGETGCTPVLAVFFDLGETLVTERDDGLFETIPAAATLIDALEALELPKGIITTVESGWHIEDLAALLVDPGLLDRFEVVLLSSEAESAPKPAPEIYLEAVGLLTDAPPVGQILFVTENLRDVANADPPTRGARAAGLVGVHVSDETPDPLADHTVPLDGLATMTELPWFTCLEAE